MRHESFFTPRKSGGSTGNGAENPARAARYFRGVKFPGEKEKKEKEKERHGRENAREKGTLRAGKSETATFADVPAANSLRREIRRRRSDNPPSDRIVIRKQTAPKFSANLSRERA